MIVRCAMVISVNGYIARLDGEEDFISSDNWQEFLDTVKECNNVVVGRKTYETVTKLYKDYNFDNVVADYKIIVTSDSGYPPTKGFTVVHSPKEAIKFLESKGLERAYVEGGELNASFASEGLINELEVVIEPFAIGKGRQGLAIGDYELSLKLVKFEKLSGDRVHMLYEVAKNRGEL